MTPGKHPQATAPHIEATDEGLTLSAAQLAEVRQILREIRESYHHEEAHEARPTVKQ